MTATVPSSARPGSISVLLWLVGAMAAKRTGLRRAVVAGAAIEAIVIGLGIAGPYLLKALVDVLPGPAPSRGMATFLVVAFAAAWAGAAILSTWRLRFSTRIIDRLTSILVSGALQRQLPATACGREGDSGRMLGLLERLPFALTVVVDGLIWRVVPLAIQLIGSLAVLIHVVPVRFAVVLALVLTGYVAAAWAGAVSHQRLSSDANAAASRVSGELGDILRNARRVVFNGALPLEVARVDHGFAERASANRQLIASLTVMSALQYGLIGFGLAILLGMAVGDAVAGRMTVANFVLLQAYVFALVAPLSGFGFILSQAATGIATVEEVVSLVGGEEKGGGVGEPAPASCPADIRLQHVSFRYGTNPAGLDDVDLVIPAGSFTAIVGSNGSGKSTLAQITAGVLQPTSGSVIVGGQDMADVPPDLRHHFVLYVPQLVTLFNRSLGDNALYPPAEHTEDDLVTLLNAWRFHETERAVDLTALAGEGGERLSGGQLQKLELARIAGMTAPAIILDESTSALDPTSEARIVRELREQFDGRTTLVLVTHRLTVAEVADQVVFLKGGRLMRQGRHDKLMADSAAYANFWKGGGRASTGT